MNRHRRLTIRLVALVAMGALAVGLTACGSGGGATPAEASGRLRLVDVTIDKPILDQTAVRLIVRNGTGEEDTLLSVSSPVAKDAMVHRTSTDAQGRSTMEMAEQLRIPARSDVTFEPGGLHVMLTGLTRKLAIGDEVPVTFRFAKAGTRTATAVVVAPGSTLEEHTHG